MQEQITAKVIQKSESVWTGGIATTFELEYPRFIHAELMTHRVFSRNSASSRAIPVAKVIEQVRTNPAMPVHWGKNQAGMQASEQNSSPVILDDYELSIEQAWKCAAEEAANVAQAMAKAGYHKQVVNRILEPFQRMKVVVTTTEKKNFYWLRDHVDAQPEIAALAKAMKEADDATPAFLLLHNNEMHVPYVDRVRDGIEMVYSVEGQELTYEEAQFVSASLCAQVSYRKADFSLVKAIDIYKRLIESEPCHASPVEHQLISTNNLRHRGWTHIDFKNNYWSGNIRGFIQLRQLIPNNAKYG